jgi:hypothetical protein
MFENIHFVWTAGDIFGLFILALLLIGVIGYWIAEWIKRLFK